MDYITIALVAVSVLLIGLILIQERGMGVGSLFGDSAEGGYRRRRGLEQIIFITTLVLVGAFAALSAANLIF